MEKYIYIWYDLFPNTYTYISVNIIFKNHYLCSSENLKVLLKIHWIFVVLLSLFVIRNFKGACSSVEMLKGYMVRERLVTLVYSSRRTPKRMADPATLFDWDDRIHCEQNCSTFARCPFSFTGHVMMPTDIWPHANKELRATRNVTQYVLCRFVKFHVHCFGVFPFWQKNVEVQAFRKYLLRCSVSCLRKGCAVHGTWSRTQETCL